MECETFEAVEQHIVRGLVSDLLDTSKRIDRAAFSAIISRRLASHWSHSTTQNGAFYNAIYQAVRSAEQLLALREQYVDGFHYSSAQLMYAAYTDELYLFDQAYRLFNEHVHTVSSSGADVLRKLDDEVENLYTNWYLDELGKAWDHHLAKEALLERWSIEGVEPQHDFFKREVKKRLATKKAKRVFVIISDALRYEVAHELSDSINDEKRFKADIDTQLGVLPSYTQLGMAALLPHQTLSYGASAVVNADDKSTAGQENRNAILQGVNGMAVCAKELLSWSNQEGRDRVRDAEVVYIYHDTIDAIGDKAATEEKTFEACRQAIDELKDLVGRVINRLNANRVLVTADHGFLFQQKPLEAADKTTLKVKPVGAIEAKKRYVIGENLPADDSYWKARLADTAHDNSPTDITTEVLVPKGAQRFHFIGGAKFVHGGAMLQEVCVPVLTVRELEKSHVAKHQKQPVGVVVASQPIKVVNNIDRVRFIQTDPVSGTMLPRKLNIVIVDADGNDVSSRETVLFDSTSNAMDERTREVRLKLIGADFDRNASYVLVLEDTATKTRYSQYAVTIDLAIQDDFF